MCRQWGRGGWSFRESAIYIPPPLASFRSLLATFFPLSPLPFSFPPPFLFLVLFPLSLPFSYSASDLLFYSLIRRPTSSSVPLAMSPHPTRTRPLSEVAKATVETAGFTPEDFNGYSPTTQRRILNAAQQNMRNVATSGSKKKSEHGHSSCDYY